jgi:hypothetical protein
MLWPDTVAAKIAGQREQGQAAYIDVVSLPPLHRSTGSILTIGHN